MLYLHKSVLLAECISGLNVGPGKTYLDATLGRGGHTIAILEALSGTGTVIGVDKDQDAIVNAKQRIEEHYKGNGSKIVFVNTDFLDIERVCIDNRISELDGVLMDLGVSSYQIDNAKRGFSYMKDGPLDMRMNQNEKFSAFDVVNKYKEEELSNIITKYGEERWAKRIAKFIVDERKQSSIVTTAQLARTVGRAIPKAVQEKMGNPAKKTFQAIRIEVNNELSNLESAIISAVDMISSGGRICIITFHSLEDRIVKNTFLKLSGRCACPPDIPICVCERIKKVKILTTKPIVPTEEEVINNKRSKSAKLRIAQKV